MSKYLNTIEYQISTKLDSKGLSQLQSQLREIEATLSKISGSDDVFDFSESIRQVRELNKALTSSFNSSIGMLDLNKFKNELNSANVTAKGLGTAFQHSGAQGKIALTNLLGQIGKIDTGIKRTNATLDKMFNTIGNTVRWGIVSSGFSQVLNSLHQSVDYVKELDDSLTQIMLVTDYSRKQMNEYAKSANEAAKALGSTTVDVTQGSLVFAQQGFDLQQSSQLAEYSIKLANASQQDTATTSDQITALMNAYNLSGDMEELKKALDSWALVANISAADVEELAKASQKAASSASTVGVSLDQMNAQIATIESVTRDAPEQIGNGLKTLYSRLSDISLGETLEDGVDLGKVTTELQKIGVQVLDQAGQMRNVGDIMEDLMVIWDDLDQTSKEAAGQAIAGKYQLNRFYALMDNSDMYRQYKTGSANASGTLDQMNQEFVDSLQGRLNKLQATWEDLFNSLFDTDAIYPFIDVATKALDLIDKAVDSIGGGLPLLTGLVGVFGRLFSNNLAQNINDSYVNKQLDLVRQQNAKNVPGALRQLGFNNPELIQGSDEFKDIVNFVQKGQENVGFMSDKQIEQYNTTLKDVISNTNALVAEQEQFEEAWKAVNMAANAAGRSELVEEQANLEEFLYSLDKDTDFGKYVNKFKQAREEAILLEKSIKDVAESTTYLVNNIGKDAVTDVKLFDKLKNDINLVDNALEDLKATGMLTWKEIDELEKSFEQVAKPIRFMDELTEETTEDVRKFAEQTQVLIKVLTGLKDGKFSSQQLRDYISKWQPNIETKQAAKERSLSEGEALLKGVDRTKQIKSIIDTTSAIGELAFAWQGFQNLGSLWKNEEISFGEKILQIIMNLSMTLPSLITSLKQLKEMGNVFSIFGDWGKEKLDKINPRVIGQNKIDSVTNSLDDYLLQSKDKITEKQEAINLEIQEKQQELKAAQEQRNRYLAEKEYNRSSEAKLEVKKNLEGTINPKTGKKWTKNERAGLLTQSQNALTKLAEEESSKIKNLEKDITGLTKQSGKLDASLGKIRDTSKSVSFNPIKIGISQLGEQFKGFLAANWPMLALTAITTAIGIYQNSLDDARKKATEFYEETKANYDQHQQSISNFETLYQTWKDTGEGAEELKKAGGELSKELNILGGDALVAAEKFDILKSKIEGVAESDRNKLINAGNAAIEKNSEYGFLNFSNVGGDAREAFKQVNWWKNQEVRDFLAQNNLDLNHVNINSENAMSKVGEAIDLVSNKLNEMTDTSSETYRQLMDIYNNLNAVYNKEEWVNIREAAQSVSEARVETDQFAEKLKGAEDSSEKLWKLFSTDYGTSTYFNNLSSDAEKYQFILQNIENEATKADLSIKQTESVLKRKDIDINLADQLQGFSAKQQMEIVATLDTTKSKEAIEVQLQNIIQQINEENSESGQLKLNIEDARERYKDVWEAFQNDEVVGYEQLKDVFGEDIVQAFENAKDQSEALKDAFILLQDATYNTQQAGIDLKATLDDLDHGLKLENLDDIEDKIQKAEEKVEDFSKLDPLRDVFGEDSLVGQVLLELDTDKAREEVQSLKDELEDETFNLSVDIGGDLLDQANMAMEALNDISTGLEKVGDDFLVAAEDAVSLENAFPGILENYTVTTEGMIQLDQAKAQSAIAAATSEAEANSKSMVQQLKDYAEYADIMSQAYMDKAELFAKMAETTVMTEDEANAAIAETDKELSETAESNLKEKDLATQQESQNEINYAKDVGQNVADAMAQGAASGVQSISDLSNNFAEAAVNMVKNAWEVADAVAQMENGHQGGSTDLQGVQLSMSDKGKSVQINALSPGETFKINGKEYQVKQGAFGRSSGILASAAQEYQAKALAFQKMAGRARASAAAMEASQMQAANDIANVGIPEAKPEKETKEPTEKEYEPKYKEPIEEEVDLYEKVNTQLDEVQETLQKIQKETDRLIGPKARANMNKQISLLEKEIGLQKEKLSIQEQERADLANELSGRYNIWFDSEGFIDNYAETLKRLEEDVNYYTNRYNQSVEEADQEFYESMIEESQAELDNFKKLYQRYDELQGKEIPQTINQIEELTNSIEDLRIEAYKTAQQAIDDLKELRDKGAELLGLFTEYESDSPFRATIVDAEKLKNIFGGTKQEAIDYYQALIDKNKELMEQTSDPAEIRAYQSSIKFFEEQQREAINNPLGTGALGLASQDLARLQKWIDNPNAEDNVFAGNDAALYEAYEAAYDRMRELALEAEKNWEQLKDDIIDGYEDIAEREEEQIERYDRISERLETIADIHSIAFGEEMYADISRIYNQIARTTLQQAKDQKTIYQNWVDRYNAIEDKTSDIAKTVRKNMEEAEDKLIELQKSVAESWQKAFENAIKEITAQQNERLFGTRRIDDISSDWERDKAYADKYYDDVQRANLIEQLRLKYMNLLDDAQGSSLDIQRRIRDAMNEQVKYLEDQKYLSEYNVKYANAQLEILQKQIALEDARNNKNQMRLRRDTQGNYRYVYSANQDDVRSKEADLLSEEFDAYNMSTENRMNTYSDWLNAYKTYIEQRESLIQRVEQGDKDAADALAKLEEDYARDMAAYSEELGDSWEGMIGALQWMAETGTDAIRDMAEEAMTAIQERTDESLGEVGIQWNATIDGVIDDIDNLLEVHTNATEQMTSEANRYKNLIDEEVAPLVSNGFENINGAIQDASSSTKDLAAATRELNEALMGDNSQLVEATQKLEEYRRELEQVKDASAITAQQLQKAQKELDQSKAQNLNYKTELDEWRSGKRQYGVSNNSSESMAATPETNNSSNSGNKSQLSRNRVEEVYNLINTGQASVAPERRGIIVSKGYSEREAAAGQALINLNYPTWAGGRGIDYEQALKQVLATYDTGGYTGKWNSKEGKLALLHQKELVLNSSDTQNILQAVDMVRNMADMLKMFSNISVKGTGFNKLGGDMIKQRVEIKAEFPNVQSSNEIEQALLNIADSAYQYSYKTI